MKKDMIKLVKITNENLELACKIQNEIFPEEDARENFIEQINKDPYRKEMDYYIVYAENIPIGVTGIYSYNEYPDDAWLGWFGILEAYRQKGYGGIVLDITMELARKKGYKNFRIYTDEYAKSAHKLYESRNMIKELYDMYQQIHQGTGIQVSHLVASGNGMRKNKVLVILKQRKLWRLWIIIVWVA